MRPFVAMTLSLALSLACGGSQDSPATGPTAPDSTDTTKTAPPADGVVALGELSLTFIKPDGTEAGKMSMDANGAITAVHAETGETKNAGTLSASGELEAEGKVIARIDSAGSVSVLTTHIRKDKGVEVSRKEEWKTIGVVDAEGNFKSPAGDKTLAFGDGKIDFGRGAMKADVSDPSLRRTAMFLLIASTSASTVTEGFAEEKSSTEAVPPKPN